MPYCLRICIIVALAAFFSGFFYGQMKGEKQELQRAIAVFTTREKINNAVDKTNAIGLCIALGGVRAACRSALRGLGETTKAQ